MASPDTSAYESFDQITGRLDQIVAQVKSKDTSIEHALDLFDEAIALGSKAVDLVDVEPPSDAEREASRGTGKESAGGGVSTGSEERSEDGAAGASQVADGHGTPKAG